MEYFDGIIATALSPLWPLFEELVFDHLTEKMHEHAVHFLDACGFLMRNRETELDRRSQLASVPTGKTEGSQPLGSRHRNRFQHVRGITAGADGDGDVAFGAEGLDLTAEDIVVVTVVRYARQDRRIRRQRHAGERGPIITEPVHELRGEMLRIGRTSPVAENEHFLTCSQRFREKRARLQNRIRLLLEERLLQGNAVFNRG